MSPSTSSEAVEDQKLRPFFCELDVLSRPDGSAIVSQGDTTAIAGVYGPIEAKPNKTYIEKAAIEAIYRPKSGLPCVPDRMSESTLQHTFEAAILTTAHPRTLITISIQEMQDSGGLLACAINAGCLAIMNSGLPMRFLVAAVNCMIHENGDIILDPDEKQLKESCAVMTFAFDNVNKNIVSSSTDGSFSETQYQEAILKCRSACDEIFQLYRDIVKKYAPSMG
ncbi:exosome complex component RRP46 [Thrips palmi]|uniref:Exosome complex component RRP46 n=1 Tax=Thrips palmi TaxID=161013 RepID=A0A6P8YNB9_THRPL|nr:exosome complex component RRP46 [Thrips palmi]